MILGDLSSHQGEERENIPITRINLIGSKISSIKREKY